MPVRKGVEVELGEARMIELGDEHGGHAVEGGAALVLDGLEDGERVEGLAGDDHAGAVAEAGEVAHDHAEAVIEGDGDADAVVGGEAQGGADEVAVI
jgi:hypothetical protein